MRKGIAIFLLLSAAAFGQQAKLLDVQTFMVPNNSFLGRWAASDGGSAVIPNSKQVVSLKLSMDGFQYTANFFANKHLTPAMLTVGETITIRIVKEKAFIQGDNGKDVRGEIVRREKTTELPASPQPASR